MIEKIYWIENTNELETALDKLDYIPCFVDREFVEMNYSEITIKARQEDLKTIEKIFAEIV